MYEVGLRDPSLAARRRAGGGTVGGHLGAVLNGERFLLYSPCVYGRERDYCSGQFNTQLHLLTPRRASQNALDTRNCAAPSHLPPRRAHLLADGHVGGDEWQILGSDTARDGWHVDVRDRASRAQEV